MLKTLIIATVLLPTLALAQRSQQLPQPRQPGQWCPVGWMASGNYCVPGLRQGAGRYSQEWLVSGRLAREWQLLHPLRARGCDHFESEPRLRSSRDAARRKEFWQRETNVWRRITSPARSRSTRTQRI